MRETYSTVKENGYSYALKMAKELKEKGYTIISGPVETMVPRGEGSDGKPIMVPGFQVEVDDGRPEQKPIIY